MPRLVSTAFVAVALTAGLVPAGPAHAQDAPTCHGRRATVVGDPDVFLLHGTRHSDVIVTNGVNIVDARAGADLICVTGHVDPASLITIDAGSGDDVVDARGQHTRTSILLRLGADTAWGGTAADSVFAAGGGTDRVWTGTGADTASAGAGAKVHLGPGDDRLNAYRPHPSAILDGGPGANYLDIVSMGNGAWSLDNRTGTARVNGVLAYSWTGFTTFDVGGFGGIGGSLSFHGSDRSERVVRANHLGEVAFRADLGGDNDHLSVNVSMTGPFDGGPGRDVVSVAGARGDRHDTATVDLGAGTFATTSTTATYPTLVLAGMERLLLRSFVHADVTGSDGDDVVSLVHGCGLTFSGLDGDDRIAGVDLDLSCAVSPPNRVVAHGGPGDDQLLGGATDDELYGDAGTDTARGADGADLCAAETRVECELP